MFSDFDYQVVIDSIPFLWEGMQLTFLLTFLAIVGGLFLGVLLALARLSHIKVVSFLAGSYVNFFRSMPLILVIFWFYFLVPFILGRPVGGFYSVLVAFTLFEGAYYCEIMRAGIQSVKMGQLQAGQAIGLTYIQNMRYVVLPQAFRNMIPILLTQAVILFQDTSLVYVVGLHDFLVNAEIVATRENRLIEMFSTVAVVYFILCLTFSLSIRKLQRRFSV
ncbi:MAG: amino acid ABC transporter permease [Gammaproteobacteria bacterium]|jgi:glutamate/aspartate transport system permease protein|nr:amino acid ABC transporter permease [Gammaproteobacteria bacterium]MBT3723402.1 amino acid ABC transporter permease [Gammaproteobacteria bacterium]MBT4077643.1 amino acid ABC transporter permease [Gammaproteobacteria bacterium]MBT4196352.1 amino acid ABC transporter permease [Gammaproteobacteria bacterium]MBT4452386.1 amino acid ABC transporter permease [Gammaproteobacteria bacterium]